MQLLNFATVVLACAPFSMCISVAPEDATGSNSAVFKSNGAVKMDGTRLFRASDSKTKSLAQTETEFCPGNQFPLDPLGTFSASGKALWGDVWTNDDLGTLDWTVGEEWTLSVVVTSTDTKPQEFGFSGEGGFLKVVVEAGVTSKEITVHDKIREPDQLKNADGSDAGVDGIHFQFRAAHGEKNGANCGAITFTKICLQKSVCEGNKFPLNPFATYHALEGSNGVTTPAFQLWTADQLRPLTHSSNFRVGDKWTLSLEATSTDDAPKEFGFWTHGGSHFLSVVVPAGATQQEITTTGQIDDTTRTYFQYIPSESTMSDVHDVSFTNICFKQDAVVVSPTGDNEVDIARCESHTCPPQNYKRVNAKNIMCDGPVCGRADDGRCCKSLTKEKSGAKCQGSQALNWRVGESLSECVTWALNNEVTFFVYGQENTEHDQKCWWQNSKATTECSGQDCCRCRKDTDAAESERCEWKTGKWDFYKLA